MRSRESSVQKTLELLLRCIWTQWEGLQRGGVSCFGTHRQDSLWCRRFCCTCCIFFNRIRDASLLQQSDNSCCQAGLGIVVCGFIRWRLIFLEIDCVPIGLLVKKLNSLHLSAGSADFPAKALDEKLLLNVSTCCWCMRTYVEGKS